MSREIIVVCAAPSSITTIDDNQRKPTAMMEEGKTNEVFDTGLRKIREELKSQLAARGLYGTFTEPSRDSASSPPLEVNIEVTVKGRVARRLFERQQIEGCHLRVNSEVLKAIASIVDELAS